MMVYGYVRVSSRDQNEARQIIAMQTFGIPSDCIFVDRQSGKDFNRKHYKRLLRKVRAGDTIVVKSIDRFGRDYGEILDQWRYLNREKQVGVVVLDMPLLDTRKSRDLTGTLISDIVLQLLSYVAQTEREFIRQRQQEGIAAAKSRGVRFGRPPKEKPEMYDYVLGQWARSEISGREAAKQLGVTHKTFLKWANEGFCISEKSPRLPEGGDPHA